MVSAIIMASGYSTRMGTNKLLLPFKGRAVIEHVIDTIWNCNFEEVILVCKNDLILNLNIKKETKLVINEKAYLGQSESIKLGILHSCNCDGYMFFTGDQPLIDSYTINTLLNNFYKTKSSIIIPKFKNRRGSPTIFPVDLKEELLNLHGDNGGKIVIQNTLNRVEFVSLETETPLLDIDTPKDYESIVQFNINN